MTSRFGARLFDVMGKARRRLSVMLASPARLVTEETRRDVETEIHGAAQLTTAYGFLLFSACGIAALGLLQSSVAVVIGAMLISPLMGPILSMGLALARVEPREFKTAAVTLAIGVGLSVLASTIIVWASPLKDVTPEILARTRPTLLDLVVALLSGFIGAYLTINRKGGAIAGVAIATALMPPLAVVGYGLATASWGIAGGAGLLFLTNVVAILGSVFAVARRYGFRPTKRTGAAWETPALFGVTVLLCIPLALSLRNIVVEARETTRVRSAIERTFEGRSPHITDLAVEARRGKATDVQCVVVTRKYVPGAALEIARQLNPGARVSVEQVVTASGVPAAATGGALGNRPTAGAAATKASPEQRLRAMLGAAGTVQSVQNGPGGLTVAFVLNGEATLADYRTLEVAAGRFVPETAVRILPPLTPLPDVAFARGTTRLGDTGTQTVETIAWALARWGVTSVEVEGLASPNRRGRRPNDERIARARGEAAAAALRELGIADVAVTATVPERLEGDEAQWLAARVRPRPAT